MQEVDSLAAKLKKHLPWHQARIIFMAQFMLSLLQARSVNLYRVAEHFQTYALIESSYRRIKRFFQKYKFSHLQLARLILHWLPIDRYILCMDRTNWQYGKKTRQLASGIRCMAGNVYPCCLGLSDQKRR